MDKRSWPWKKKSATTTDSGGNQRDQDNSKVQISAKSYARLTELEDQVKVLGEKLSSAQSEMSSKDNMVKQHTKVAEEAVSGWEKAEAEAVALKQHLESVMLLKLTAEDRVSHLDDALKECMKQMRNLKEENERKIQDIVVTKTKQWEKVKSELETKIVDFEQELLRSSAESAALSRSLQERSNLLMKINNEKSQADAEIEVLKTNIQSCEKEINSLKYELHIISKELEIRNEEKNMSIRSAEAANKQHIEDVRKIMKLEAECQRLRGLVRKKLPGPAALAQMKLEVENLGRDHSETRSQRYNAKSLNPYLGSAPDFSIETIQLCHKENELLTARVVAMEEETNMLRETLSKCNIELQASRNMYAKTLSKLRSIETHMLVSNRQKNPSKPIIDRTFEGSWRQTASNASLTSMSEDGIDEEGSCSETGATVLMSDISQFKKEKIENGNNVDNSNHLELMHDFLEMERLAYFSTENNRTSAVSDGVMDKMKLEVSDATSSVDVRINVGKVQQPDLEKLTNLVSCIEEQPTGKFISNKNNVILLKLQSSIASIFEARVLDTDMGKILKDVAQIVQDMQVELSQHPYISLSEVAPSTSATFEEKNCIEGRETINSVISLKQDNNPCIYKHGTDQELKNSLCHIHDFVVSFCEEALKIEGRSDDDHGLREKVKEFSMFVDKVLHDEINLDGYICALSHILSETRKSSLTMLSGKSNVGEINNIDCIDKVTLLENNVVQHEPTKERYSGDCTLISSSVSDPEIFQGHTNPGFDKKATLQKLSLEESQQMKLEKDSMHMDLVRCNETLECTKLQLIEMEQHVEELKSQLATCQKSNSLADTQLRCMTESYKSLELHTQELENELNLLRSKAESLDRELQEETRSHQDDLARYEDLQEKFERNMRCSICSKADEIKMKQEKEFSEAAEKLAECQENIFLLGRQLKALGPPADQGYSLNSMHWMSDEFLEDGPSPSVYNSPRKGMHSRNYTDQIELENADASTQRTRGESPSDGYDSHLNPNGANANLIPRPPTSSKRQKHRSRSASSSSLSSMLSEKQERGFSRFFRRGKE